MAEHQSLVEVTRKDTLVPCALKIVCYNADTPHNKLFLKGLPVIRARLFRSVRPICLVAAVLAFGLPAATQASAQTKPSSSATATKKAPPTKKKPAYSAKSARARRAALAKARAAAAAKALAEAQQPRFKFDDLGALVPDIRAEAAIIYNPQTGKVLWESHSQDPRSIASITKVMTAAVLLEDNPDLTQRVVVQRADTLRASTTYLRAG